MSDKCDSGGPCCAHRRINYVMIVHGNGTQSNRWECNDCGTHFAALEADVARLTREHEARGETIKIQDRNVDMLRLKLVRAEQQLAEAQTEAAECADALSEREAWSERGLSAALVAKLNNCADGMDRAERPGVQDCEDILAYIASQDARIKDLTDAIDFTAEHITTLQADNEGLRREVAQKFETITQHADLVLELSRHIAILKADLAAAQAAVERRAEWAKWGEKHGAAAEIALDKANKSSLPRDWTFCDAIRALPAAVKRDQGAI